jgi:hypothetical protein
VGLRGIGDGLVSDYRERLKVKHQLFKGVYSERLFNKSLAGTDLKFPYLSPTTNSSLLAALVSASFRKAFFKPYKMFSAHFFIPPVFLFLDKTLYHT